MTIPELIAQVEEAVKKVTPRGRWYYQEESDAYTHIVRCDNGYYDKLWVVSTGQSSRGEDEHLARYIAAANPVNILRLCEEIKRMQKL